MVVYLKLIIVNQLYFFKKKKEGEKKYMFIYIYSDITILHARKWRPRDSVTGPRVTEPVQHYFYCYSPNLRHFSVGTTT